MVIRISIISQVLIDHSKVLNQRCCLTGKQCLLNTIRKASRTRWIIRTDSLQARKFVWKQFFLLFFFWNTFGSRNFPSFQSLSRFALDPTRSRPDGCLFNRLCCRVSSWRLSTGCFVRGPEKRLPEIRPYRKQFIQHRVAHKLHCSRAFDLLFKLGNFREQNLKVNVNRTVIWIPN